MKFLDDKGRWAVCTDTASLGELTPNICLLTRFNLKFWKVAKSGLDTRSNEWMNRRFDLFETYCVPSVAKQTFANFTWFCLFADDTTPVYLDRIKEIKRHCKQFYPLLLTDEEGQRHDRIVTDWIDCLRDKKQPLITLRIDNDDAIALDFVATAMDCAVKQREAKVVYWFDTGIQYYHCERLAFVNRAPHNHYPFLVNKNVHEGDANILTFSHRGHLPADFTECVLHTVPMWMEVIHEDNVMNEVNLNLRQVPFSDAVMFHHRFFPEKKVPLETRFWHYLTFLLPRMTKHLFRRVLQKIRLCS